MKLEKPIHSNAAELLLRSCPENHLLTVSDCASNFPKTGSDGGGNCWDGWDGCEGFGVSPVESGLIMRQVLRILRTCSFILADFSSRLLAGLRGSTVGKTKALTGSIVNKRIDASKA